MRAYLAAAAVLVACVLLLSCGTESFEQGQQSSVTVVATTDCASVLDTAFLELEESGIDGIPSAAQLGDVLSIGDCLDCGPWLTEELLRVAGVIAQSPFALLDKPADLPTGSDVNALKLHAARIVAVGRLLALNQQHELAAGMASALLEAGRVVTSSESLILVLVTQSITSPLAPDLLGIRTDALSQDARTRLLSQIEEYATEDVLRLRNALNSERGGLRDLLRRDVVDGWTFDDVPDRLLSVDEHLGLDTIEGFLVRFAPLIGEDTWESDVLDLAIPYERVFDRSAAAWDDGAEAVLEAAFVEPVLGPDTSVLAPHLPNVRAAEERHKSAFSELWRQHQ